jgi:hypothetical protein
MKFLPQNRPFGHPRLARIHARIVPYGVHCIGSSPDMCRQPFLDFKGKTIASEVDVRMALGIAIVLSIDDRKCPCRWEETTPPRPGPSMPSSAKQG